MARLPRDSKLSKADIGRRIRLLREERALSQAEFGRSVGMTQSNVSAVERGGRGATVHQIVKIAQALGVPADGILTGGEPSQQAGPPIDRRFVQRLQRIDRLSRRDRDLLLGVIDKFLATLS